MAKILLDYFFKIIAIEPTAAASTAFLKQVLVIAKPKAGVDPDTVFLMTSATDADAYTANLDIAQLFAAGMTRAHLLTALDLADVGANLASSGTLGEYFTILVSSDYTDLEVADLDVGEFDGVVGVSAVTPASMASQAVIANRVLFKASVANKAKNMFYAFGKLLSATSWANQQYITMPFNDDVGTVGAAEALFDLKASFAINDDEYGNRLALFAAGGKAIVAPYIKKNLMIDLQSKSLQFISGNQPSYSMKNAALLEDELQQVIDGYVERALITEGTTDVTLVEDNFVANAGFNISEPKALWRIQGEIKQTL